MWPTSQATATGAGQWFAGLDGFRGLAVIAVVLFHADLLAGGWLGVDLFFVLSGVLITRLITIEHRSSGRVSLGAFWRRRARRLLPALVVFFPAVGLLVMWTPDRQALPANLSAEMVAAIAYVANWFTLFSTSGYWDEFSVASPLRHMWSLAIEEQFYVVFPLVAAAAFATRRRRALLWILAGATVASWTWAMYLLASGTSFERVYLGTDTRLAAITLGGVAGFASVSERFMRSVGPLVRWLTWPAFAWVVVALFTVSGGPSWTAPRWSIVMLFELAAVVLLLGVLGGVGSGVHRWVAIRPLLWFGTISYGLYLWHIPVQFVLAQRWPDLDRWFIAALTLGLGSLMAWVSYTVVERPLRHRGLAGAFGPPARQLVAVVVSVLLLIGGVAATARPTSGVRSEQLVSQLLPAATAGTAPPASAPTTTRPALADDVGADATETDRRVPTDAATEPDVSSDPDLDPAASTTLPLPIPRPMDRPPSMLFLGDSMVRMLEPRLVADADRLGTTLLAASHIGCPSGGREVGSGGSLDTESFVRSCDDWLASLPSIASQVDPDVIVIFRNGTRPPSPSTGPEVCDDRYLAWFRNAMIDEIESLTAATDAQIVLTTHTYHRFGGVRDDERDAAVDCVNDAQRELADATGAAVVDLARWVCPTADTCRHEQNGVVLRRDGLHFEDDGASLMLDWMIGQVFVDR